MASVTLVTQDTLFLLISIKALVLTIIRRPIPSIDIYLIIYINNRYINKIKTIVEGVRQIIEGVFNYLLIYRI